MELLQHVLWTLEVEVEVEKKCEWNYMSGPVRSGPTLPYPPSVPATVSGFAAAMLVVSPMSASRSYKTGPVFFGIFGVVFMFCE